MICGSFSPKASFQFSVRKKKIIEVISTVRKQSLMAFLRHFSFKVPNGDSQQGKLVICTAGTFTGKSLLE